MVGTRKRLLSAIWGDESPASKKADNKDMDTDCKLATITELELSGRSTSILNSSMAEDDESSTVSELRWFIE